MPSGSTLPHDEGTNMSDDKHTPDQDAPTTEQSATEATPAPASAPAARERWITGRSAAVATVSVVLLGAAFASGWAVGDHGHGARGDRFELSRGMHARGPFGGRDGHGSGGGRGGFDRPGDESRGEGGQGFGRHGGDDDSNMPAAPGSSGSSTSTAPVMPSAAAPGAALAPRA
jgi:hypothetical protein